MRYTWNQADSLIRNVDYRPAGKQGEALVYAADGASADRLSALSAHLREQGFQLVPDIEGDRPLLRIEKLENAETLLAGLHNAGATLGEARTAPTDEEKKAPAGFAEKFKRNTVKSAGYAYVLGDSLMVLAGLVRMRGLEGDARKGGMAELATGALWFAPNVALAVFGKKNPEIQTEVLMRQVKDYLDKQGVEVPTEDRLTLEHLSRKDGPLSRIVEFFYEHPTEINNAMEATGGLLMIKGGYEQKLGLPNKTQPNPFKMAAGAIMGSGMGASVVMKENPAHARDSDSTEKKSAVAEFFSKPLKVAGTGALINNFLNIIGASMWEGPKVLKFQQEEYGPEKTRLNEILEKTDGADWKAKAAAEKEMAALEKQNIIAGNYGVAAKLNLATAATFILANGMYAMGSKDTGADIKAMGGIDRVYAITAHVIAAQPQEHQRELINRMAGFLSAQSDVKDSAQDIVRVLHEKVQGMEKSPWAARVQSAAAAQEPSQPSL